jgi:hypothetical protein
MAKTMTYREFYTAIINFEGMTPEMVEFAKGAIDTLDRKNSNRKSGNTKTAKAMAEWRDKMTAVLTEGGAMTAKQIAKELSKDLPEGADEVSTQKVTAIAKSYPDGVLTVYEDKDTKKNKVKFYKLTEISD